MGGEVVEVSEGGEVVEVSEGGEVEEEERDSIV